MQTATLAPAAIPQTHACRITLRRSTGGVTFYGVISPKTGCKLEVQPAYLADCPRIRGRIVQAVSRGMTACFTVAELRQFADAARRQAEPRPLRYWGRASRKTRRAIAQQPARSTVPTLTPSPTIAPTPAPAIKPANTVAAVAARLAQVKAAADEVHAIAEEHRREIALAKAEASAAASQRIIDQYVAKVNAQADAREKQERECEAQRLADGRAVAFDLCRRMDFKTAALMRKLGG